MSSALLVAGSACGGAFGFGLLLLAAGWPSNQRPTLDDRLAPYVRDAAPPSTLLRRPGQRQSGFVATVSDLLQRLLGPVLADLIRAIERSTGGSASVRRRLDQLGGDGDLDQFRAQQVVWGAIGFVVGVGCAVLLGLRQGASPVMLVLVVLLAAVTGVIARDQWLSQQVRAREQRILVEFPTVAELLALSVSAGEGPVGALERVSNSTSGELSVELRRTLADARAGAPLVEALRAMAGRTSLPILARFVDGVAVAVERGTPLADVLRSQAGDVRAASRRQLMESGGKREIAMMVPVVFLVLPVTVFFAIYPGIAVLGLQGP